MHMLSVCVSVYNCNHIVCNSSALLPGRLTNALTKRDAF